MSTDRLTRVNELMRREIGEALFHVLQDYEVDMSLITVTHVSTSSNLRTAHVYISIRDHADERQRMMRRIARHSRDIQRMINLHLKLKYTPKLIFELDEGLEKGDKVLNLLREMDEASGGALTRDLDMPPDIEEGTDSTP